MTRPRSQLIDRENGGFYHLGSRCVRRAMLCGEDPVTGRDFSYRRAWIENLLLSLTEVFTVEVCSFAVMSNHYHITANYRPQQRMELTGEEVARRWLTVFPPKFPEKIEEEVAALLNDVERLVELRRRLGDLSWYMRCLNETIARRANKEDDCTGRFWEGRYKSKNLPSTRSVWACMAYDDLNPVRAKMADRVDAPEHTSLQRRLEEAKVEPERLDEPIKPLVLKAGRVASAPQQTQALELTLREYCAHVEWTADNICPGTKPEGRAPPRLGDPNSWLALVASFRARTPVATLPRWVHAFG